MPQLGILNNNFLKESLHLQRIVSSIIIVLLLIMLLLARLIYLQVHQHHTYKTMSRNNNVRILPLIPPRGLIFDSKGVLLAKNSSIFSLAITRYHNKNVPATIQQLQEIISLNSDEQEQIIKKIQSSNKHTKVIIKPKLNASEVAKFSAKQHLFVGVEIIARLARSYPYKEIMAPILGYSGPINSRELARLNPAQYRGSYYIGKMGLEKSYETLLHGTMGQQIMETNARGQMLRILDTVQPIPGDDLHLTIDKTLQIAAFKALGTANGAIVALDPNNGNILALVSKPSFDPNIFIQGISHKQLQQLNTTLGNPLVNKAITGKYPPASTIKPMLALQGLDLKIINNKTQIYDPGWYKINDHSRTYRDMYRKGHGWINLDRALTVSCDTFFYGLAHKLGIANISSILQQFGLGSRTGIDLPNESAGLLPSRAWKRQNKHQAWFHGDTINIGIGQGYLLVTPLQMAQVAATIATKGKRFQPRLQAKEPPIALANIKLKNNQHFNTIIKSMRKVVTSRHGSARIMSKNLNYTIAAKTGTAQVFGLKQDDAAEAAQKLLQQQTHKLKDHAWCIAFAPVNNPRIAIAVLVEHGKGSTSIAKKVLDKFFAL